MLNTIEAERRAPSAGITRHQSGQSLGDRSSEGAERQRQSTGEAERLNGVSSELSIGKKRQTGRALDLAGAKAAKHRAAKGT